MLKFLLSRHRKNRTLLIVSAILSLTLASSAFAEDPSGMWRTPDGKGKVRISKCGENLCARLASLAQPLGEDGKPKTDYHNENESLRSRPMLGLDIFKGMKPDGDGWRGSIYNAEDGKTYSATFKTLSASQAKVEGCVLSVFCKSQIWTRD